MHNFSELCWEHGCPEHEPPDWIKHLDRLERWKYTIYAAIKLSSRNGIGFWEGANEVQELLKEWGWDKAEMTEHEKEIWEDYEYVKS